MTGRGKTTQTASFFAKHLRVLVLVLGVGVSYTSQAQVPADVCNRELSANIVAIDMPLMFNRLGAQNINGMMYALRGDVVSKGFPNSPYVGFAFAGIWIISCVNEPVD